MSKVLYLSRNNSTFLDVVVIQGGITMKEENAFKLGFAIASITIAIWGLIFGFIKLASKIDSTTRRVNALSRNMGRGIKNLREMKFPKTKRNYHLLSK